MPSEKMALILDVLMAKTVSRVGFIPNPMKELVAMIFKEMKIEDVLKALEGQEDVLSKEVEAHNRYIEKLTCFQCGSPDIEQFVDPEHLFKEGSVLPNYLVRCTSCGCEFEPYTKVQVKLADEENLRPVWTDI